MGRRTAPDADAPTDGAAPGARGPVQPGVAVNADSVRKLMDGMRAGRAEMLRIEQDEDQDMAGYLTPVQRARYQRMREPSCSM